MISVRNLKKEYKSINNKNNVIALNNISFDLPSKGLVFIVGKSGSGKSTLLNLLGGLDTATSGVINIDGNNITQFSEGKLEDYRNTYLGFIFQDYYLIESLTVYENIKIALDLKNESDELLIYDVLRKVGLDGYENKFPKQLSGGERQRVSIARAIVKKPKLLLADELTANLDVETSKMILNLLQELSKDLLVVVVSHNIEEANYYADRKIELYDGMIFKDETKDYNEVLPLIQDNVINIPFNRRLTKEELNDVNENLIKGNFVFNQQIDSFRKTEEVVNDFRNSIIESAKMKQKTVFEYARKFSRGNILGSIITSIMFSLIVLILYLSSIFATLDVPYLVDAAQDVVGKEEYYILAKGAYPTLSPHYLEHAYAVRITDEDIQMFYEKGYEGKIYKLYGQTLPFDDNVYESADYGRRSFSDREANFYIKFGSNVLPCDMEFLSKVFGKNDNIEVLAGSIEPGFKDNGYIITDYAADAILYNWNGFEGLSKEEGYKKIIEMASLNQRFTVKAIVATNYLDQYEDILVRYDEITKIKDTIRKNEEFQKFYQEKKYIEFNQKVCDYYSIGYYLGTEEEFINNYFDLSNDFHQRVFIENPIITSDDYIISTSKSIQLTNYSKGYKIDKVNNGEIYISPSLYNKWFGTEYTYNDSDKIIQHEVRIRVKEVTYNNEISIPKDRTFKIAGLVNKGTEMILLSEDDFLYMGTSIVYPHTAYFDNIDSITKAYVPNSLKLEPFYCENEYYEAAYEMNEVVGMFNEVFLLIFLALIFICIIILCGFCFRMIKRKKYDVGVYKAIGGRLSQFRRFFTIQLLFVFLLIAIFSTTLVFTLAKPLNDILVNTLIKHNKLIALKYIVLIKPDIYGMSIIYLFVFILLMITYVWSLATFKRVKPINIIRDLK